MFGSKPTMFVSKHVLFYFLSKMYFLLFISYFFEKLYEALKKNMKKNFYI